MSQALAVKRLLRDKLQALPGLVNVDITYGYPTRAPGRHWVALAEIEWSTEEWATNRGRTEEFAITVCFDVQQKGGTSEECESVVHGFATLFETALINDPGLGGLAITSGYRPLRLKSWPIDDGYESQYEIEVSATCRLQRS